jgi:hypothetical protein
MAEGLSEGCDNLSPVAELMAGAGCSAAPPPIASAVSAVRPGRCTGFDEASCG